MIVERHIAKSHAALIAFTSPFENIVVKQGLIEEFSIRVGHDDNWRHFNDGALGNPGGGVHAPTPLFGMSYEKYRKDHLLTLMKW